MVKNTGRQPIKGFTPCRFISANCSRPAACMSSPQRALISAILGARAFCLAAIRAVRLLSGNIRHRTNTVRLMIASQYGSPRSWANVRNTSI